MPLRRMFSAIVALLHPHRLALACLPGLLLHLIPRRHRFAIAVWLADRLQPIVRRMLRHLPPRIDGTREESLRFVCRGARRFDVELDPTLIVRGAENIGAGGAIFISGHFLLNGLFARWLHDQGHRVSAVMRFPPQQPVIMGTRLPLDVIKADELTFVRIRQRVADGGMVIVDIDDPDPSRRSHLVETRRSPRYVSEAVLKFAEHARIPLLFCATRVTTESEVLTTIARPSMPQSEIVMKEFCLFLQAEAAQTDD